MTPNRMVRTLLPMLALTLLLAGCPKKEPAPVPEEIPMETKTIEQPTQEIEEAPPVETTDTQEVDPLDSEDLRVVNDEARRQGFNADVHFALDQSTLSAEASEKLARNAAFLKQHPEFVVTVEGHCDERGTNEYNLALGERRSYTARDYLVSLGVDASRLRTITYGEERPVCTESDESCWWRNRRAHMFISGR